MIRHKQIYYIISVLITKEVKMVLKFYALIIKPQNRQSKEIERTRKRNKKIMTNVVRGFNMYLLLIERSIQEKQKGTFEEHN